MVGEEKKWGRNRGDRLVSWTGESTGITAQVESKVGDPHFHLSCIQAWMRPSHLSLCRWPELSLSLSLSLSSGH